VVGSGHSNIVETNFWVSFKIYESDADKSTPWLQKFSLLTPPHTPGDLIKKHSVLPGQAAHSLVDNRALLLDGGDKFELQVTCVAVVRLTDGPDLSFKGI
jgi:hypothetical protein